MRTGLKTHYIGTLSKIVIYMEITRAWGVPLSWFNDLPQLQSAGGTKISTVHTICIHWSMCPTHPCEDLWFILLSLLHLYNLHICPAYSAQQEDTKSGSHCCSDCVRVTTKEENRRLSLKPEFCCQPRIFTAVRYAHFSNKCEARTTSTCPLVTGMMQEKSLSFLVGPWKNIKLRDT